MADPATPAPQQAPPQPVPPQPAPDGGVPVGPGGPDVAAQLGWLADEGAFVLPFGVGLRLTSEAIGDGKKKVEIAQSYLPKLPGLTIETAEFNPQSASAMVKFKGHTAIPLTEAKPYSISFKKADGKPSEFAVKTQSTLEWLGKPSLSLSWTPAEGLKAEAVVKAEKFVPKSLAKVATAQGDLSLSLANGMLSGAIDTTIATKDVLSAHLKGAFTAEGLAASVDLATNTKWLGEVKGQGAIDASGQISARIDKAAGELPSLIPGLTFNGGMMSVILNTDGTISGGFEGLTLDYAGLATATASFTIEGGKLSGAADLALAIPGMNEASGKIAMKNSLLSGSFALSKDTFPEGLPLQSGSISGTISETGALAFKGSVGITLGPAGTGQLTASYSGAEGIAISATVDLAIPGLQTAKFTVAYDGAGISGEGELAVDPTLLAGITGYAKVTYKEGLWAGEATLGYEADNGKLSGSITVRVRQAEDASLKVSGEGDVTAKIAPRLEGKLHATIKEEGGIDVSGEISVTEPIPMFPEYRVEKELLNISQSIPLWAILVAVLRIRAGVRAGIGPGVFRNIKITGSYTIGEEGEPSFAITGEMFIPAFVEGYVGFGAGLGLDVVLGSLTGGIEAMGTAGIYGAISVIPVLAYENGDYSIEGVATMAAGARLKLSLNAWAEVEALWITVWDNTWELASVTMPIGPDLGLQAKMAYTFGKPDPPTLDFSTSDIDTDRLVQDAMPKDGPPNTGTREAVKNEAKWQGEERAKGPAADAVPPELQAQAATAPPVAEPKGGTAPSGKGAKPKGKDDSIAPEKKPATPEEAAKNPDQSAADAKDAATPDTDAKGTVADDNVADTKKPRHGAITLAMLDGPSVPMPRSKEQVGDDVKAAAALVRLISASGETTDVLDNYFPRIKERFKLTQIGYVRDASGVQVLVKINDEEKVTITEEIQRLDHPLISGDITKATKIRYEAVDRKYSSLLRSVDQAGMGVKMTADPLTPLHGQGSGPKSGALSQVFNLLETQGETGSHGYVKGHLLNDNLGGPGEDRNLFPITQTANARHSAEIEETAKQLVNDNHYWVRYTVAMQQTDVKPYTDPKRVDRVVVNSIITASLDVLLTDNSTRHVKTVQIPSIFNETRGEKDLHGMTRKELETLAKGTDEMAAKAAKELETRKKLADEFLATDQNAVRTKQDDALLKSLEEKTATTAKEQPVAATDVLLSTAKKTTAYTLNSNARAGLNAIVAAGGMTATGLSGTRDLAKRLEDVPGLGKARMEVLKGSLNGILAAEQAVGMDQDIGADPRVTDPVRDLLAAMSKIGTKDGIAQQITQMAKEKITVAEFDTTKAPTKDAWLTFAAAIDTVDMGDADRIIIARMAVGALKAAGFTDTKGIDQALVANSQSKLLARIKSAYNFRQAKG